MKHYLGVWLFHILSSFVAIFGDFYKHLAVFFQERA